MLTSIVLLTSIMITTIVYSTFSTQLQISGEAIVRSDNEIRITNVKVLSQTNNAFETYNNKYTKDTTSMFVTLPSNSSMTYEVEITDKVNVGYIIESIEELSNTNSNVDIDIGLNQYDLVNANSVKKFNISFTNVTNEEQISILVLNYKFLENRFVVTFDANGGQVSTPSKTVSYGSAYGTLPTPTKNGYTFKGWNGKNLFSGFNKNVSISSIDGTEGSYPYGAATDFIEIDFDESNYYISGLTDRLYIFWAYYDENYNYLGRVGAAGRTGSIVAKNRDIVTSSEKEKFLRFYIYQNQNVPGVIDEIDDLNIQFEKGTKTTTFEPYILINDTDVTQMKNHTLTAIWEEN